MPPMNYQTLPQSQMSSRSIEWGKFVDRLGEVKFRVRDSVSGTR